MGEDRNHLAKGVGAALYLDRGVSVVASAAESPSQVMEALAKQAKARGDVEELTLKYCRLGPREMTSLGQLLGQWPNLTCLDLRGNQLASEGLAELGRYTGAMRRVRSLLLASNRIGPIGLSAFMRTAEQLDALESFDLADNPLGDEGAEVLSTSAGKLRMLRQLALYGCGIGDTGVESLLKAVCESPWRDSLKEIGFHRNPVSRYRELAKANWASRWREQATRLGRGLDFEKVAVNGVVGYYPRADNHDLDPATVATDPVRVAPPASDKAPTLSVQRQWNEITRAVATRFGREGERQFCERLRHRSIKSALLRQIHDLMEARAVHVRAYTSNEPKSQRTSDDAGFKKPHHVVHQAAFGKALSDDAILAAIFRLVTERGALPDAPADQDDPVFICPHCGAMHLPNSDAGDEQRRPAACQACGRRGLNLESLPKHWLYCGQCEIDFRERGHAEWSNPQRRAGRCPKGHALRRIG